MKQNQNFSQIGEINVYFQIKTLKSAGVMILFNSNFDYEIEDYIKDNDF